MYNISKEHAIDLLIILAAIQSVSTEEDCGPGLERVKEIYYNLYVQVFSGAPCSYEDLMNEISVSGVEDVLKEISDNH